MNGDVFFDFDLRALVARHRASGALATLALRPQPDPRAYSPVVTDRRGRILSIAGRPRPARGTVSMFASVHVLDPRAARAAARRAPPTACATSTSPLLAEGAHLAGVRCAGAWYDFGRPSLYRDAQLRLLRGPRPRSRARGRGARIAAARGLRRSVVGARSRVASGARVERSVLWDGQSSRPGRASRGSIVTTGGVVRTGERAEDVIVLPLGGARAGRSRGRVERHGDMAWVGIE